MFIGHIPVDASEVSSGWEKTDSQQWSYYQKSQLSIGWKLINQNWYYFNQKGFMKTGWEFIDGKWYYLDSNGVMKTGWELIGGKWYYLDNNGVMKTGWEFIDGKWYYLDSNGVMKVRWQLINQNWYYFTELGEMQINWQYINKDWYYFYDGGEMATGWILSDKNWYYLNNTGIMAVSWHFFDDEWFFFEKTGQWLESKGTQFINSILSDAIEIGNDVNLYPSVMIAQAAIESGYGTSLLAEKANNFFGMKFKIGEDESNYDVYFKETQEYIKETDTWITVTEPFRKYKSCKDSLNDYAFKLRNGVSWDRMYYQGTWRENSLSYREATASIKGKYATDPDYENKLNNFIELWNLNQID